MEDTTFWLDLEARFCRLHKHQLQQKRNLHALFDGNQWHVDGGTKQEKKQFEWLAERAAVRLGYRSQFCWLDLLRAESPHYKIMEEGTVQRRQFHVDLHGTTNIEYKIRSSKGGVIELLCKASAEYCIRCETQEKERVATDKSSQLALQASGSAARASLIWEDIKHLQSIREKQVATALGVGTRTIRNYLNNGTLDRAKRGWVTVNHKLYIALKNRS